ncbi:MAG: glycosyltransferase family 2 protein [Patescibacteria group bacterium]|mgnify:CR=1 FL=1
MPELSIIIVHHRTPELLKLCLTSIKKTVNNVDYEVIIVDSATTRQGKYAAEESFPEAMLLSFKENLGYSRGVNAGIKKATGKYFLILNPDVILTENAVAKMLGYMKKHPDIGMLGPKMLNFNGTTQKTYFSFYKPITIIARRTFLGKFKPFKRALYDFLMADSDTNKIQTPDWLMGSAIMVARQAIERVGGMDERFFMYFEDVDWARRLWRNDFKVVYFPEAIMYHYHQRESESGLGLFDPLFNKKTRWHIRSAIKFFWKYRNLTKINEPRATS